MAFIGISGMQYSGASLSHHRILVAEDSNVFTSMISKRLKELFDIDVEICRSFEELPANTQAYVKRLEELIRCRISGIGVGPGREQAVMIHSLLD